jgi:hypothetical protein
MTSKVIIIMKILIDGRAQSAHGHRRRPLVVGRTLTAGQGQSECPESRIEYVKTALSCLWVKIVDSRYVCSSLIIDMIRPAYYVCTRGIPVLQSTHLHLLILSRTPLCRVRIPILYNERRSCGVPIHSSFLIKLNRVSTSEEIAFNFAIWKMILQA